MNDQQEQPPIPPPGTPPPVTSSAPPPNYLVWGIITTILCCLPFGIVSIIYAAQVNSKWQSGDVEGAKTASKNAKTWAWVAFGVGIAGAVIAIIWSVLVAMGVVAGLGIEALESLDI